MGKWEWWWWLRMRVVSVARGVEVPCGVVQRPCTGVHARMPWDDQVLHEYMCHPFKPFS